MGLSIFDLFKVGIGPSSSHTVGPMVAANRFVSELKQKHCLPDTARVCIDLFGSLALTGAGHGTDTAIILGLSGQCPQTLNPDDAPRLIEQTRQEQTLFLANSHPIAFSETTDLLFHTTVFLPKHPNGMAFKAVDKHGIILHQNNYYSLGGGFIASEDEDENVTHKSTSKTIPYPFNSAKDLLDIGRVHGLSIAEIVLANEHALGLHQNIPAKLQKIWQVMDQCIERGCRQQGILPGGLKVKRRANAIYQSLSNQEKPTTDLPIMDWVSLYALAVNEENAVGGRIVTAPTNGAAGVIPAVLAYFVNFVQSGNEKTIETFLATAAAIGMLYKKNASISAAEVGCQGEIGVACSMAAGALCAALGGTNQQIENAAEIGMEHNLGLTCDPVGGLVQVPCIERNTMGAIKAIAAARLSLQGNGDHRVSLDDVIKTMRQTGLDMQHKYKETALGGLAVNVVMC
ncbi:L-serine ammonia-lyase [Candidatus Sororendozoicomonas aggregata]|uniref:L-serine ammonia-lyase n=1 Tax=Candidatus Sororendozoicomonas aggregata TaxID=3073239 RepID=UPI002ED5EAFB